MPAFALLAMIHAKQMDTCYRAQARIQRSQTTGSVSKYFCELCSERIRMAGCMRMLMAPITLKCTAYLQLDPCIGGRKHSQQEVAAP